MARKKKKLVKKNKKEINLKELVFVDLVEIIKSKQQKNKKDLINNAYKEVEKRMKSKMMQITIQFSYKMMNCGLNKDDIYQEALFALRFKAIPDYDESKGNYGPYPFDKFAVLCIRRHLSTLLKSSYQNKKKALNTSVSLDRDVSGDNDKDVSLGEIIPRTSGNVLDIVVKKEMNQMLFGKLFSKLSKFEKIVIKLYMQRYSYEEMSKIINLRYKKDADNKKKKINLKSVDNALSRIKQKAREINEKI
jgi:RNA polymerase sporulation-specific sigma factor